MSTSVASSLAGPLGHERGSPEWPAGGWRPPAHRARQGAGADPGSLGGQLGVGRAGRHRRTRSGRERARWPDRSARGHRPADRGGQPPAALLRPASIVLPPGASKRASRCSVRLRCKPRHRRRSATEGAIRATQRGLLVRSLTGCGVFLTMVVRYLMFRGAGGFSDLA